MRTTVSVFLLLVPVFAAAAPAAVHFEGNQQVATSELEAIVQRLGSAVEDRERLRLEVMALYYDEGFVDIQVDQPVRARDTIVLKLQEGSRYHLGQVKLAGPWPPGTAEGLQCHSGDIFSRARLTADFERLKAIIGRPVTILPSIDKSRHTMHVTFQLGR